MATEELLSHADNAKRLVFAMCHEISNLVAAVRLQAHLIDEDLSARGLAVASLEIDDASARSSALLALIRPVLSDPKADAPPIGADAIACGVERALEDYGGRGVELGIDTGGDLPKVKADPEVIHYLLLIHVYNAMETVGSGGTVRVHVETRSDEVAFIVEESGETDDEHLNWREGALRGRTLSCAISDYILAKRGGHIAVSRQGERTHSEICTPIA
jgi:signal transduction histidine kinase